MNACIDQTEILVEAAVREGINNQNFQPFEGGCKIHKLILRHFCCISD